MAEDPNNGNGDNGNGGTSIKTPWFSASGKKTAELITILSCIGLTGLGALYWKHDQATAASLTDIKGAIKEQSGDLTSALKEMASATKESAQAQRYMACMISEPQNDRPRAEVRERCKELSRLP